MEAIPEERQVRSDNLLTPSPRLANLLAQLSESDRSALLALVALFGAVVFGYLLRFFILFLRNRL
jgi:hypothetical protein